LPTVKVIGGECREGVVLDYGSLGMVHGRACTEQHVHHGSVAALSGGSESPAVLEAIGLELAHRRSGEPQVGPAALVQDESQRSDLAADHGSPDCMA
jgi:hypothetical protein